jgi:hypothetical protein
MEDRQEHGKYDPHQSMEIEESNVNRVRYIKKREKEE